VKEWETICYGTGGGVGNRQRLRKSIQIGAGETLTMEGGRSFKRTSSRTTGKKRYERGRRRTFRWGGCWVREQGARFVLRASLSVCLKGGGAPDLLKREGVVGRENIG